MINEKLWKSDRASFKVDIDSASESLKLFNQFLSKTDIYERAALINLFVKKVIPFNCYNGLLTCRCLRSFEKGDCLSKIPRDLIERIWSALEQNTGKKRVINEMIGDSPFFDSNNLSCRYLTFTLKIGEQEAFFISFFEKNQKAFFDRIKSFYLDFCSFIANFETIDSLNNDLESQYEEFNSLFEQLHWFHEIADSIKSVHDIRLLSKEIVDTVKAFYYDSLWALIYISDKNGLSLLCEDAFPVKVNRKIKFDSGRGILEHAFLNGVSLKTGDKEFSSFLFDFLPVNCEKKIFDDHNIMTFPLLNGKAGSAGIIVFSRKESFTENDRNLLMKLGEYAGRSIEVNRLYIEQREKDKLENDLRLANDIQQRLLPKTYPEIRNIDIYGMNIPAKSVGGDYFDVFRLEPENPDSKIAFLVGDVAGKGVSAALVMAMTRSFLRAAATSDSTPKDILKRINRQILEDTQTNIYVTMFFSIYDPDTGELKYSKAGHNPPLLYKRKTDSLVKLSTGGLFLGMFEDGIFEEKSTYLEAGDKLIFYTDGVTEAMNLDKEEFKSARFFKAIEETIEFDSISSVKRIYKTVNDFVGDAPIHDDFTLLIISNKKPGVRYCSIPHDEKEHYIYIDRILGDVKQVCASEEILYTIRLCLDELITNYLKYSASNENKGWLNLKTSIRDNKVVFDLHDRDSFFDFESYFSRANAQDLFENDHRGLIILKKLADDISFSENGKHIKLMKLLYEK